MITKNSVTKSNLTSQLHMTNLSVFILNNFFFNRPFSTTTRYLSPGEDKIDKGKGKATKEDMVKLTEEEAAKKDIKESRKRGLEEKEMGEAIQESKRPKKLNTNEEAGPSNYQVNTDEKSIQTGPSNNQKNSVVIPDDESYNSDSSIATEYQYANGIEDQTLYNHQLRENYENNNSDDPSSATELEVYIKAQEKELKLVKDILNNSGLSKAERSWHEGRQVVIVKELDDSIQSKETREAMFRDFEGLDKTPLVSPPSQTVEDSEDNNSSDSDKPDDSGPSASPSNPGPAEGPGDLGSNESGPTGEEGSDESYKVIPSFVLNFVAEIFEHITNIFFF